MARPTRCLGRSLGVASVTRHTSFSFTLDPTREQEQALSRHVGAARFSFNQCLRLVLNALEARKQNPETRVPWSGFDLINAFNAWKRSSDAGMDEAGEPGLVWRDQVCQQIFEEAAIDLGRALEAVSAGELRTVIPTGVGVGRDCSETVP